LKGCTNIVRLRITIDGVKIPLGLWEGSTETATVATALLSDLVQRGLGSTEAAGVYMPLAGTTAFVVVPEGGRGWAVRSGRAR